jgi:Tol biopolymer transport system component
VRAKQTKIFSHHCGRTLVLDDPNKRIGIPAWSPDGEWFAYVGISGLFIMREDGGDKRQIADGPIHDPGWSPDAEWLIFSREIQTSPTQTKGQIFVVRPDSTEQHELTSTQYRDFAPYWLPDGNSIIFGSGRGSKFFNTYYQLWLSDSHIAPLRDEFNQWATNNRIEWSSDGNRVVFNTSGGYNVDVFRITVDGSQRIWLTDNVAEDMFPSWSPPISLDWRVSINTLAGCALLLVWIASAVRR